MIQYKQCLIEIGKRQDKILVKKIKCIDDDGSVEKPELGFQRRLIKYSCCDPLQAMLDRDTKVARQNFCRKRNQLGAFLFLVQDSVKLKVT